MLTYQDTIYQILALERRIKKAADSEEEHIKAYGEHSKNLLKAMISEHRKAARREKEYTMR